jgi:hypothetical protein
MSHMHTMTRQIPLPENKESRLKDYPFETLEVVCRKCGRAGRYGIKGLILKHGPDFPFMQLRKVFESTCEKTNDVTRLNEVCGVGFPDMVRWKLGREPGG